MLSTLDIQEIYGNLLYGLPAFALAVVGIPVYVHIPKFYADEVGVNIALIGSICCAESTPPGGSTVLTGVHSAVS